MGGLIGLMCVGVLMIVGGAIGADRTSWWKEEVIHASLVVLTVTGWCLTTISLIALLVYIIQGAFA